MPMTMMGGDDENGNDDDNNGDDSEESDGDKDDDGDGDNDGDDDDDAQHPPNHTRENQRGCESVTGVIQDKIHRTCYLTYAHCIA